MTAYKRPVFSNSTLPFLDPRKTVRFGLAMKIVKTAFISIVGPNRNHKQHSRYKASEEEEERESERWVFHRRRDIWLGEPPRRRGFGSFTGELSKTLSIGLFIAISFTEMYSFLFSPISTSLFWHFFDPKLISWFSLLIFFWFRRRTSGRDSRQTNTWFVLCLFL